MFGNLTVLNTPAGTSLPAANPAAAPKPAAKLKAAKPAAKHAAKHAPKPAAKHAAKPAAKRASLPAFYSEQGDSSDDDADDGADDAPNDGPEDGRDDDLFFTTEERASKYGSSPDWKFDAANTPQHLQPTLAIAPENAIGRTFMLPRDYAPFAGHLADEEAGFLGWMGTVKSVVKHSKNKVYSCEFYDAYDDIALADLASCRMLS